MNDMSTAGIGLRPWPRNPRYIVGINGVIVGPSGKQLKPRPHMHGYVRMSYVENGKRKDSYVHRVVCETFNGPPPDADSQVDHINGIRNDNRAINLRWVTKAENLSHRKIPSGEGHANARLTDQEVIDIRAASGSQSEIALQFGVSREHIRDIRNRKARKNA